jgi:hypothetical protein
MEEGPILPKGVDRALRAVYGEQDINVTAGGLKAVLFEQAASRTPAFILE